MLKIDLTKIKAYGDRVDDGAIQMSLTFPVSASEEAKAAAKLYVEKLGLKDVKVIHMEPMGEQFTFFVIYAHAEHSVNLKNIKVPKIDTTYMDFKTLSKFMQEHIHHPLVVLGAATGTDAHTVGIDAIFNMKGYNMDYGLERYPMMKAINLRSQVDNEHFVARAEEMGADAVLISQVVTQRNAHVDNLKDLKRLIDKSKKLKPHLITIIGGPRIDHALAKKLGYDAGFGTGTVPSQVASFIVHEFLKRTKRSSHPERKRRNPRHKGDSSLRSE